MHLNALSHEIQEAPAHGAALREAIRRQGSLRVDYHVHTRSSNDCGTSPEDVLERAVKAGLGCLCVTDHDTIEGALALKRIGCAEVEIVVGCEFSTEDGSQVIGLDLTDMIIERRIPELLQEIRQQGGLVLLPHPFRRGSGIFRTEMRRSEEFMREVLASTDLVECFNGRDTYDSNRRSYLFAIERGLPAVAGSDAHTADEVGSVFVEYPAGEAMHGHSPRRVFFPDQRPGSENAVKRRLMELYHRHEASLPGVARSAYRVARRRFCSDRPPRHDAPARVQYQFPPPLHPPVRRDRGFLIRGQLAVKRAADIVGSAVLLLILLPALVVIGVAIKATSPGDVVFRQQRIGMNGRLFTMYKFRTMTREASRSPAARISEDDPRITRIGRFLRSSSLDELPQLLNVLRGEMSIVGPRPDIPRHVETYTAFQRQRLAVRPGITGWAQVSGRNQLSWEERIKLDVEYIQSWSLLRDLEVIARTAAVVLSGKGAALPASVGDVPCDRGKDMR